MYQVDIWPKVKAQSALLAFPALVKPMKVGSLVRRTSPLPPTLGIVTEIGSTMIRVAWFSGPTFAPASDLSWKQFWTSPEYVEVLS